jgi:hypothetical protein
MRMQTFLSAKWGQGSNKQSITWEPEVERAKTILLFDVYANVPTCKPNTDAEVVHINPIQQGPLPLYARQHQVLVTFEDFLLGLVFTGFPP